MLTTVFGSQARFVLLSVQHRSQCSIVVAGSAQTMLGKIIFSSLSIYVHVSVYLYMGKHCWLLSFLKLAKLTRLLSFLNIIRSRFCAFINYFKLFIAKLNQAPAPAQWSIVREASELKNVTKSGKSSQLGQFQLCQNPLKLCLWLLFLLLLFLFQKMFGQKKSRSKNV